MARQRPNSGGGGASAFVHDPLRSFDEQTIFWAPEIFPAVVGIVRSASGTQGAGTELALSDFASDSVRQAPDGWHAVLRMKNGQHHLCLREAPQPGTGYAAELPFDPDYEIRVHASCRLWRALNRRPPGPPFHHLSVQRRERLAMSLRALDGHMDGATYRAIAEVLFGRTRIPEGAWKTHDLRSRTIRLVQAGVTLMQGGYRALLRPSSRNA